MAVLGIAGTVAVFVAMLAMERGFRATLVSSGSPENAMVRRGGASAEMESILTVGDVRIIDDAPGIARADDAPLVVPEVVVVASFPLKDGGTDAKVQVRGTTERVLKVRERVRLTAGRLFHAGLFELVVGKHVAHNYAGFGLGDTVRFGGGTWTVVGIFDAGGSAFDSEVWCDADVLNQTYQRPAGDLPVGDRAPLRARRAGAAQVGAGRRPAPERPGGARDRLLREASPTPCPP